MMRGAACALVATLAALLCCSTDAQEGYSDGRSYSDLLRNVNADVEQIGYVRVNPVELLNSQTRRQFNEDTLDDVYPLHHAGPFHLGKFLYGSPSPRLDSDDQDVYYLSHRSGRLFLARLSQGRDVVADNYPARGLPFRPSPLNPAKLYYLTRRQDPPTDSDDQEDYLPTRKRSKLLRAWTRRNGDKNTTPQPRGGHDGFDEIDRSPLDHLNPGG